MSHQDTAVALARSQFQAAYMGWLEGTMQGVTAEKAAWRAAGRSAPIGAQYAHAVVAVDFLLLSLAAGRQPLAMTTFAGKTGLSEPYPMGDWGEWSQRVTVDLDVLHVYALACYAAADEYLGSLQDEDLAQVKDLSAAGFGEQALGAFITTIILHAAAHSGEIAVLKGLQDLKGYPF